MPDSDKPSENDKKSGPTNAPENDQEIVRDELRAFAYELRDLLKAIVEDGRFIPEERLDDVQRAWLRVQARFIDLIRMLDGPLTNTWPSLEAHGLTGDELALKRRGWLGSIFAWGRRINRGWVRGALRWGDTLLGSLSAVFPPAGAIKEFKEALENLIEDSEADARRGRRGRKRNPSTDRLSSEPFERQHFDQGDRYPDFK